MREIVFCINQIIELLQILVCLNFLFCRRFNLKISDGVFVAAEVIFFELANLNHLSGAVVFAAYLGMYVYAVAKFKSGLKKTTVNVVLFFVINSLAQLICSGVVYLVGYALSIEIDTQITGVIAVNISALLLIFIVGRKGRFYKLSRYVLNSSFLTYIAMAGSLVVVAYLLAVYKLGDYFRITDYLVFGVVTVLICVLALSWQKEHCDKVASEKEIALRERYDKMFQDLVTSVRKKQHDIDDHINVIYCQHKMAGSLEELVSLQKEYCKWIMDENSFSRLLSIQNSVLGGFLYSKFCQAKEAGCDLNFDIKAGELTCAVPVYKIVEMLSALLNNAREAVAERSKKNLFVRIRETEEKITFLVQNSYDYVPRSELVNFIQLGYSTKGKNRGLGLANVMDILNDYDGEMEIQSGKDEEDSWVAFEITLKKEG